MIKQLNKREQKIFMVCIAIVAVYVGYNGLIKPLRQKIISLDQNIERKQIELKKDLRIVRSAKEIDQKYNEYLNVFQQIESDEQVMSSILADIEKVANELGLRISDLKPSKVKGEEGLNVFPLSLIIDGELTSIMQFLYVLQGQPYLFNVEQFRFDRKSQQTMTMINANLILSKTFISQT